MFYPVDPPPGDPSRGPSRLRRAALPQPLLVPRRRVGAGRPGRARGRAGPGRAGGHGPPGPVRRGPVRDGGARRRGCARSSGSRSSCVDARVPDPGGIVVPARRAWRPGRRPPVPWSSRPSMAEGRPARPRPERARLPGHRAVVQGGPAGDRRGGSAGRTWCCWPGTRRASGACAGWCAGEPGRDEGRAAVHPGAARGARRGAGRAVRAAARASSRGGCGPATARARGRSAERVRRRSVRAVGRCSAVGRERLRPRAPAPPAPRRRLAGRRRRRAWPTSWGCPSSSPTTSTTHRPEGRELQDVLTAIRHGRTLRSCATCAAPTASRTSRAPRSCSRCRRASRRPRTRTPCWRGRGARGSPRRPRSRRRCRVELAFERYRFPGFDVPKGETPFSHLRRCARRARGAATTR